MEAVKVEALKLEEEKNIVKQDARLGLGPMTEGPIDVLCAAKVGEP